MQLEEDDDYPRNINIRETEGCCEVWGPPIEDPDIIAPLKTKQVNIGIDVEPKYAILGDYWDDAMVDKVIELLHEYQDLFPTKIMDLKGIIGDLGMMKITLKPDGKLVKQRPYRLNPKYKAKVRDEIDKMLAVKIIEQEYAWNSGSSMTPVFTIHSLNHSQMKYWRMLVVRKLTHSRMAS